ncbi:Dihydroneopterin aldolase [Hyphodiscus hymeniophilus]|uniref:Folic acid synthesis protein FOL1 n=1 Tax=Hyphodiscus hymeniophilus TaxID=353542 RepID=A0A9P7AX56_9HELO|nr:Dihydroneopterin aldolase [Hyphodiscus hymeniophilus]
MKIFRQGLTARGRALYSRKVPISRTFNATTRGFMASTRLQSTTTDRLTAAPWSQHPLAVSTTPNDDTFTLPKNQVNAKRTAYIALGSNLGDKIGWIDKACNEMSARGIKITRTSSLWETEPMYVLDQDSFINGACEVETTLDPLNLLNELQSIENDLGRKKIIDKGPRNIDLDILLYEDEAVDHPRLKIPHIGMHEREFVLRPLSELVPGKALYPASPWKVTQDYLNALPPSPSTLSTLTPTRDGVEPLRAMKSNRPTQVMAILNLTPDSFSDGGKHSKEALGKTLSKIQQASFIDFGGQSSAPHAKDVSAEEEASRVVPIIQQMRRTSAYDSKIISVDTYRASVAEAAVRAGADIVNDISAGLLDPEMLPTMARLGKTVCLMHMRGTPATMNKLTDYSPLGLIPTIANELLDRVSAAQSAGVRRWRIVLDPGVGFAKTGEQNLEILRNLDVLRDWPGLRGFPWLVGSSRKNFVGRITGVSRPHERTWGTAATVAAAIQGGADIVRVHDVEEMAQVAKMSDAIWRP